MRLLYLCSDFGIDPAGTKGASIHLRAITRELSRLGHQVLLLSPKDGPGDGHPAQRLLPAGCPPADECNELLKGWMAPRGLGDELARELRPMLYNAWVLPRAAAALAEQRVAAIIERLSLFGHVGIDLADALDVPLIVEVNALLSEEARRFRSLQRVGLAEKIEERVLRRADAIVTVSAQLAEQIAQRNVSPERIHVVPNGADMELFTGAAPREDCRRELGLGDEFIVGFVGSLKPWHGTDILLAAFARLCVDDPTAKLLIVGAGPEEARLRESAAQSGIAASVMFSGAVAHERVPRYVRAMDVAAAPYLPLDGFYFSPIKLFEYLAAGTCVVASRIGQVEEVIEHGRNGLLCPPGDESGLYQALAQLRGLPALRTALAATGSQSARAYTWERAARQTETIVAQALAQRRASCVQAAPTTGVEVAL